MILFFYVILLIVSVYYIAIVRGVSIDSYVYLFFVVLKLRFLCSLLLMLSVIVVLILTRVLIGNLFSVVDIVILGVVFICWFIYLFYVWNLKYFIWRIYRGFLINILIYILIFIFVGFLLYIVILLWIYRFVLFNFYFCVCVFVYFGLYCVYLLLLLFNF